MRLAAKDYKDFNEIALIYCKLIDRVVSDPKCEKSFEFRGGRKGSQNTPRIIIIHPQLFDKILELLVGKKINKFKMAFNKLGWLYSGSKGIKRSVRINGKAVQAVVIYEEVSEFVDEMIRYSESGDTWQERWQTRLNYEPPLLIRD